MKLTTYIAEWNTTDITISNEYRRLLCPGEDIAWKDIPITMGNVCTDKDKLSDRLTSLGYDNASEIAAIMASDPDAISDAESDSWECPAGVDYTPDSREADWLDAVQYNIVHHRRWNMSAELDESGKRVNDKLDPVAWKRHAERTQKARAYHGIEDIVFNKDGSIKSVRKNTGKAARIAAKLAKLDAKRK